MPSKENLSDALDKLVSEARTEGVDDNWQQNLADELRKPIKRKYTRRRVYANEIDEIWAVDLVEMGKFKRWNNGVKYLLMVRRIIEIWLDRTIA